MNEGTGLKRVAALLMFLGIALGAFGAHSLEETLLANERIETWETAVFYHLIHALALFFLAYVAPARSRVAFCLIAGVVVFSGSLYVLSLTNILWLGAITPIGGLFFLAAWGSLFFRPNS